jgi:excinuclease ABC subunit B
MPKDGSAARAQAVSEGDLRERLAAMRLEMFTAAENLDFEKAARMRDELKKLESIAGEGSGLAAAGFDPYSSNRKRGSGVRARGTAKTGGSRGARGSGGGRRYKSR